ncbi:MAG: C39 family peptidase [Candidatus Riflebacteria bacterium]|nr:C39 family peptidase [Candidatus Riflebacteria bacterium]
MNHFRRSRRFVALLIALLQFLDCAALLADGTRLEFDPIEGLSHRSPNNNDETGIVDVYSRLNVRDGPGITHNIIGKLYPGDKIRILSTDDGWHRILWNGRTAWCCAYWVHTAGESWNNSTLDEDSPAGRDDGRGKETTSRGGGDRYEPVAGGSLLNMPLLNQNTAGGSYPGGYCGPTTVRMVMGYYGMRNTTADQIALGRYGPGTPMYRRGMGSTHEGMSSCLRHFGLRTNLTYSHSLAALRSKVSEGHPVIINLHGNYGPFSTEGHITVVVGFTRDGSAIINDSAGGVRRTIPAGVLMRTWNGLCLEVWK